MDLLYNQQNRAVNKNSPLSLSWRAISTMYSDISGRNIDSHTLYREFLRKYDKNKSLFDKVIAKFDENGISLKTRDQEPSKNKSANDAQNNVISSAKRASKKLLNK